MSDSRIISGKEFSVVLCKSLGLDPNRIRRIVLDVSVRDVVIAYVELIGDSRLLEISQTLDGVKFDVRSVESMKP